MHIIAGIFGSLFTLFIVFAVVAFFVLRAVGRTLAKAAPWVGVPLALVGLAYFAPSIARFIKGRAATVQDIFRPEAKIEPEGEPSAVLYREEVNQDTGEVIYVPVS